MTTIDPNGSVEALAEEALAAARTLAGGHPQDPARATLVEAALERWRRSTVREAVLGAQAEDRLLYRFEAEAITEAARGVLLGAWAPAGRSGGAGVPDLASPASAGSSGGSSIGGGGGSGGGPAGGLLEPVLDDRREPPRAAGNTLRRLAIAIELGGGLERALADEALARGEGARAALGLGTLARAALDAHLHHLDLQAQGERAVLEETLLSLRALFANLRDGLLFVDRAGIVVDVNRSICRATRRPREAILGRRWDDVWPEARESGLAEVYRRVLATGEAATVFGLGYTAPGAADPEVYDLVVAPRQVGGRLVGTVSIVHYRTEQARLEAQLLAADKMASIGRLAAGIAHEFRNLLAGVRALAEIGLGGEEDPQATFRRILRVADQASQVAMGLLSFARRAPHRLERLDAGELLHDAAELGLGPRERGRFAIEVAVDEGGIVFEGDRGALTQALVNLVLNAAQAMQRDGGRIRLVARAATAAAGEATPAGETRPAGGATAPLELIELVVEDDGPGVPAELRERIFEPFFSGREAEFGEHVGTGLGLPMVRGIAQRHAGDVRVEDAEAGGSRFVIRLPRRQPAPPVGSGDEPARSESGPAPTPSARAGPSARVQEGGGRAAAATAAGPGSATSAAAGAASGAPPRVLIVDDAKVLRQIVKTVLERAGLDASTARTVGAARRKLRLARDVGRPFAVLLLDLVVPGMRGPRTIRALKEQHPDLRLAILTGHSLSDDALREVLRASDAFIEKPFHVTALVDRVLLLAGLTRPA